MTTEERLLSIMQRVADGLDVKRYRVAIGFADWPEADGGPGWSITASIPNPDKRKTDRPLTASGTTLDELTAEIAERVLEYNGRRI